MKINNVLNFSRWRSIIWHNLLTLFFCSLTTYLGILIKLPLGYVITLVAPAGIALGAILVWGLEVIPGIFIASIIMTLCNPHFQSVYPDNSPLFLFFVFCISFGAICQVLFGRYLIKQMLGLNNLLIHPRDILLFSLICGPISSLVNSFWGGLMLYLFHIIPSYSLFIAIASWWISNTIRTLIFTPLFLIFFARPRSFWQQRIAPIGLPLLLSFFVTLAVYGFANYIEFNHLKDNYAEQIDNKLDRLHDIIIGSSTIAQKLSDLVEVTPDNASTKIENYRQEILNRYNYIPIIEWLPIDQKVNSALSNNPNLIETLQNVAIHDGMAMSKPIILPSKAKAIVLVDTIHRDKKLAGFSLIAINIDQLINDLNLFNQTDIYSLKLSDGNDTLFQLHNESETLPDMLQKLSYFKQIKIFDQTWTIQTTASIKYLTTHYSTLVWLFLVGGLFFCILMNILLFILFGQTALVQSKVEEQTSELTEERNKNMLLLTSANEGICEINADGIATFINPAAAKMLGYSAEELLGKNLHFISHHSHPDGTPYPIEECPMYSSLKSGQSYHVHTEMLWRKDGTSFWIDYNSTPLIVNGKIAGAMVVFTDVTKQRESELELIHLARYDLITNLPNRLSFLETLVKVIDRAKQSNTSFVVCFLDLDNFKQINDSLGHNVGDDLLKKIPEIFQNKMRKDDYLARLGGDEFGLILENIHSEKEIDDTLKRFVSALHHPIKINDIEINITVSIGAAIYPSGGKTANELIKNADMAMYHAKENGRNTYAFYDEAIAKRIDRRHAIDNAMHYALQNKEFRVLYQPQINVRTNQLSGFEALLRWSHPTLLEISPKEFITIAEDNGLIQAIGNSVLHQACHDFLVLSERLQNQDFTVAVNVSIKELEQEQYLDNLQKAILTTGIPTKNLFLEITESALMKNTKSIAATMVKLKEFGVRFALDDFGTGYSSMQYLKNLPISTLKIDQSFIRDIPQDENDAAIIKAIIQLAHSLNIHTMAEGVETEAQLNFLREQGCDQAQGFYFNKPLTLEEVIQFYAKGTYATSTTRT